MAKKSGGRVAPNTYVTIQSFMVNDLDMSSTELIAYAVIYGYCQGRIGRFYGSRSHLSKWMKCKSLTTVSRTLESLVSKGYIIKGEEPMENGETLYYYTVNFDCIPGYSDDRAYDDRELVPPTKNWYPPSEDGFEAVENIVENCSGDLSEPLPKIGTPLPKMGRPLPKTVHNSYIDNNRDIPYPEPDPGRESPDYRDSTMIEKQTNGAANICSNDSAEGDTPSERFERMLSDARGHRYENCLPEEAEEIASQLSKTFADSPRRQNLRHQIEMCGPIVDRLCGSASSILRDVRGGDEIPPKDAVMEAVRGVLRLQGDTVRDSIMSCWLSDNEERIVSAMRRSAEIGVIGGAGGWSKW